MSVKTTDRPPTLTLSDGEFQQACKALAGAVSEYQPDLVVGIVTGGAYVADAMVPHLAGPPDTTLVDLRRPSTGVKERLKVGAVLRSLPPTVTDALRRFEVETRERFVRVKPPPSASDARQSVDTGFLAAVRSANRVLVVDDTVDSGRTLTAAVGLVRSTQAPVAVRTAVLTSTWKEPPVKPDYSLYDRTLLRFPWSFDA
jgi:hypoxanthine phosphoribosyltransferase